MEARDQTGGRDAIFTFKESMSKMMESRKLVLVALFVLACTLAIGQTKGAQKDRFRGFKKQPKIVFLITEDPDNYEAHKTIPAFAEMLRKKHGYETRVLLGSGAHGAYRYNNFEMILEANVLVVFARRIALPQEQITLLKRYLENGKPLIGIRTANHAFTARTNIAAGFEDWPGFVPEILGCDNHGYGPVAPGTDVSVVRQSANHQILQNVQPTQWHSKGNLYLVAPLLDTNATILLQGKVNHINQPVAWTRTAGKSRIFYTSLGFPDDFKSTPFTTLLANAILWSLGKD